MKQNLARAAVKLRRNLLVDKTIDLVLANDSFLGRAAKSLIAKGFNVKGSTARNTAPLEAPKPDRSKEVRLLIAPFNYAGQGYLWAKSAENNSVGSVSARNFAVQTGSMNFEAHAHVPAAAFIGSSEWRASLEEALADYTHVIIESFGSIFGLGTGKVVLKEIAKLQNRGLKVALLCHGSDIRSPERFVRDSAKRGVKVQLQDFGPNVKRLQRAANAGREVLNNFAGPVFVSTPDLLQDVPYATLLPVVIDPRPWQKAADQLAGENARAQNRDAANLDAVNRDAVNRDVAKKLRVLHVPSNASIKGTPAIDAICQKLEGENLIEYVRLSGVDPQEMPNRVAEADIVIDQLLLGSYGVAACEAMAAKKPVISNVSDYVREQVLSRTGIELPIVQAEAETLEKVLREFALDWHGEQKKWHKLGAAGANFVNKVHSGKKTLPALNAFLGL